MSFLKTLATLAVGVAAAKGYDRFRQAGGMAGLEKQLREAGNEGGMADQMGRMMESLGVPGGSAMVRDMVARYAPKAADAGQAAEAGLGQLMGAVQGMVAGSAGMAGEMVKAAPGGAALDAATEDNAKLMIRAMIQAAKADGAIDASEQAKIMGFLGNANDEERAFVKAELTAPVDLAGLIAATGAAMKSQIYSASLMAVTVDNAAEADYLRRLAEGLGLDPASRDAIHARLGVAPMPA